MTPSEVQSLVDEMARTGTMPMSPTGSTMGEVSKSLARYFNSASAAKVEEFTSKVGDLIKGALNTEQGTRLPLDESERAAAVRGEPGLTHEATIGEGKATARGKLLEFLQAHTGENIADSMNLDFFLRVPTEVAQGAAQKLAQNWDADRVSEFPALELRRVFARDVERGSEKDPAGEDNAWDSEEGRWTAACEEAGDDDAAKVFEDTGRMVALKSSDVWQSLGDGAGGYDDCLGNDFPPFAWNSGMMCDEVSYDDCVELGLLEEGEEVEAPELDLEDLIPEMEEE